MGASGSGLARRSRGRAGGCCGTRSSAVLASSRCLPPKVISAPLFLAWGSLTLLRRLFSACSHFWICLLCIPYFLAVALWLPLQSASFLYESSTCSLKCGAKIRREPTPALPSVVLQLTARFITPWAIADASLHSKIMKKTEITALESVMQRPFSSLFTECPHYPLTKLYSHVLPSKGTWSVSHEPRMHISNLSPSSSRSRRCRSPSLQRCSFVRDLPTSVYETSLCSLLPARQYNNLPHKTSTNSASNHWTPIRSSTDLNHPIAQLFFSNFKCFIVRDKRGMWKSGNRARGHARQAVAKPGWGRQRVSDEVLAGAADVGVFR